ncbi:hypothetical protein SELMODRAFT_422513 [Selaginella moellendorffii]|uniref:Uncharacterized protein n=1 Tax=Selaginella moellendorffii TaxID=88036 RepID=D8SIP2_SELML|nr:hypothetical protein SELMODRAFT_422513 [Selaginella moellendorffii]
MDPHSRQANAGDSSTPALARKPPACGGGSSSATKIKKGPRRRVLADLTNSDSPITGLAPRFPAAAPLCDCSSPGTPGTPGTPGAGEDLLRSQTVVSERHLSLADRFITRSLNFDSLLDDALSSDNVAGDADTASQR